MNAMFRKRSSALDTESAVPLSLIRRLRVFWVDPVDAWRVRTFECLFTLTFLVWMSRCFLTWEEWLTREGFHLTAEELAASGYPAPWPLLEPGQVPLLGIAILLFSVLLLWPLRGGIAGAIIRGKWLAPLWLRRIGLVGLFACAVYVQRVDFMSAFTLNKLYVGIYALLALAPGMWLIEGTGRLVQSAAPLRVLQATLVLQYFAAGLAKADGDWLKFNDVLWGQVQGVYRTEAAAWALRNLPKWGWTIQQHVSLLFELFAPVLFCVRRLRPLAFVLGMAFHLVIALMMKDLILFSIQILTFYILFTPSRWIKAVSDVILRSRWGRHSINFGEEPREESYSHVH